MELLEKKSRHGLNGLSIDNFTDIVSDSTHENLESYDLQRIVF